MLIKSATFVGSSTSVDQCPDTNLPEFAFIGRSNVGKSSLINMLVGRKSLAKVSVKPGKTQTVNHFLINDSWYLVDLPGYGYAGVSRSTKETWPRMIATYLTRRGNLLNTFVLIDSRLKPQAIDIDFIQWMGRSALPFSMVFTKSDKISRAALTKTLTEWRDSLQQTWEIFPPVFVTSAEKRDGREELLQAIADIGKRTG